MKALVAGPDGQVRASIVTNSQGDTNQLVFRDVQVNGRLPDALFRFHLRHLEQTDQHAEPVTPRQPGQLGGNIGNEGRGLVRPAIP